MSGTLSHDVGFLPPWSGADYAANTAHHRAHDDEYLRTTPLRPTDRVLDLGCGSGDLTAVLAALVPDGHVVGVDAQPSMLDEARRRARPNQSFVEAPVQRLDAAVDGPFDLVVSRACLHWVPGADWPGVLAAVARLVRPGGWVRIECGGAGNVPRIVRLLDDVSTSFGGGTAPWTFHDAATALELLEAAGLDAAGEGCFVRTVGQRQPFDEESMRGWLRSQALQAYEVSVPFADRQAFRETAESRLDELRRADGSLDQTYVRLDVLARRRGSRDAIEG